MGNMGEVMKQREEKEEDKFDPIKNAFTPYTGPHSDAKPERKGPHGK